MYILKFKMQCNCDPDNSMICSLCVGNKEGIGNIIQLGFEFNDKRNDPKVLDELILMDYTDEIKIKITQFYNKSANGKIKRNAPRRATIYCSIMAICKKYNIVFDSAKIKENLNITDKDINKAVKDIGPIVGCECITITMEDMIRAGLNIFNLKEECVEDIMIIYRICKDSSPLFNSSKMETLSAGLLYYYLITNLQNFNQEYYFEKSRISKDTILSISENIKIMLK